MKEYYEDKDDKEDERGVAGDDDDDASASFGMSRLAWQLNCVS